MKFGKLWIYHGFRGRLELTLKYIFCSSLPNVVFILTYSTLSVKIFRTAKTVKINPNSMKLTIKIVISL